MTIEKRNVEKLNSIWSPSVCLAKVYQFRKCIDLFIFPTAIPTSLSYLLQFTGCIRAITLFAHETWYHKAHWCGIPRKSYITISVQNLKRLHIGWSKTWHSSRVQHTSTFQSFILIAWRSLRISMSCSLCFIATNYCLSGHLLFFNYNKSYNTFVICHIAYVIETLLATIFYDLVPRTSIGMRLNRENLLSILLYLMSVEYTARVCDNKHYDSQ